MGNSTPAKLIFGIVLAALCLPCSAIGGGMIAAPDNPGDARSGIFVLVFSLVVFGVPGAILLVLGLATRKRNLRLQRVAALGRATARLPLSEVARDLDISAEDARTLVLDAIGRGLMWGRLDLEHGVFLSGATSQAVRQVPMVCRSCGARSEVVVSPNAATVCPFCGFRMA